MRWRTGRRSENVEDRRGDAGFPGGGSGGGRLPVRMGRVGGGLGTILLLLVGLYFGVDLSPFLGGGTTQVSPGGQGDLFDGGAGVREPARASLDGVADAVRDRFGGQALRAQIDVWQDGHADSLRTECGLDTNHVGRQPGHHRIAARRP